MSAHVLLNLLNRLRKRNKMQSWLSTLSLFCSKFNKFNNTGARLLDSIYHRTSKLNKNHILGMKILSFLCNVIIDVIM